jgi:hypothetical protein
MGECLPEAQRFVLSGSALLLFLIILSYISYSLFRGTASGLSIDCKPCHATYSELSLIDFLQRCISDIVQQYKLTGHLATCSIAIVKFNNPPPNQKQGTCSARKQLSKLLIQRTKHLVIVSSGSHLPGCLVIDPNHLFLLHFASTPHSTR